MLPNYLEKVKLWIEGNKSDLIASVFIFLAGMAGFGMGRLSVLWQDKTPLEIAGPEQGSGTAVSSAAPQPRPADMRGQFVGSQSGSLYHYPWCAGALRIKDANKIWFQTKAEAEQKGYKPAGNCPGL